MPIQNYSQDVFFYPWVGKNYGDGINFAPDGRLIFFNKEDEKWYYYDESNTLQEAQNIPVNYRPLRLEVLGKEHYCESREDCAGNNFKQQFDLEILDKTILTELEDINNKGKIRNFIKHLIIRRKIPSSRGNTPYQDKLYVLYYLPEYNTLYAKNKGTEPTTFLKHIHTQALQQAFGEIQKDLKTLADQTKPLQRIISNLSSHDLHLCMAIEKILTICSLWGEPRNEQVDDLVTFAQNFNRFIKEADEHLECHMHEKFWCPCCKKEEIKCTFCEQMPICHYKTQRQMYNYTKQSETDSTSHNNFRKALNHKSNDSPKVWNHVLFTNFYQRSMPYKMNNSAGEIAQALRAFAEIVIQHQPDIIITWGKEDELPILGLQDPTITLRKMPEKKKRKYFIPRLHISYTKQEEKDSKYNIPFTVLDYNGKHCLVLMPTHPGTSYSSTKINTVIRCAFKYYGKLIQWNPTLNEKNLSNPITCEFCLCEQPCKQYPTCPPLTWTNESDFNKCI
ncbi:hypothetical protein [Candidatus Avelusimicrobium luingense]|uniref:hypothetical protein n=1 Tax=Candidatus Avelusimicrobium luingense TaxID=3416211 RepID=UPI003D134743